MRICDNLVDYSFAMAEYRRRLPHFHPDGEYLFVTWRLHGTLPLTKPNIVYPTAGHVFAAEDRALAHGCGPLWLSDNRVAGHVAEAIRAGESGKLYELSAWVVMPNHVHLLILPHKPLPRITHWVKGTTARESNLLLGRSGEPFWQHESYDHWVRNEKEFRRIVGCIEENPVKAGLVAPNRIFQSPGLLPHRHIPNLLPPRLPLRPFLAGLAGLAT